MGYDKILEVINLSHRYNSKWAIRHINFALNNTGVVGLLGSNGAGKSTTMNIICGVLNQTEGRVAVAGVDIQNNPKSAKQNLGFLPQNSPLYFDLTVNEYLRYCGLLRRIHNRVLGRAVEMAKDKCGLTTVGKRLIKNLSGGYRQRVGIAQAIIHSPKLVILDEPTNGLDPNQILEVRKLILEIGRQSCVILSSHILSEIEATCTQIKMIENGRMIFDGTLDLFHDQVPSNSIIIRLDNTDSIYELLELPIVSDIQKLDSNKIRILLNSAHRKNDDIIRAALTKGWGLQEIYSEKVSLDDVFATISKTNK